MAGRENAPELRVLQLAPLLQSGAGRMIVKLALGLGAQGIECSVMSSGRTASLEDWPDLVDELAGGHVDYTELDFFSRDPAAHWRTVEQLARLLGKTNFDLLHAHSGVPAAAAHCALALAGMRRPVVATFHSWGLGRPGWMDTADLCAFARCDHVTVVSTHYRGFLLGRGIPPEKLSVVPPGVDPSLLTLKGSREALGRYFEPLGRGATVIAQLGVIEPRKNQRASIEALALLPAGLDARLLLIGTTKDREYQAELEALAERAGVGSRVRFTGHVPDPLELLAAADLFLFPTLSEGLGIAILEAMALGVPVLASSLEGTTDVVSPESAAVVDPRDPRQIAGAIGRAVSGAEQTHARCDRARALVRERYLWPVMISGFAGLYRQLAGDTGSVDGTG